LPFIKSRRLAATIKNKEALGSVFLDDHS